ncbi:MAG: CIA30 family protein [Planctomycetaceae bacterium]|nr:CIA30 family protein [Planctomycetaceae bacterium]
MQMIFVSMGLVGTTLQAEEAARMLFTFDKDAKPWQTVNDGVMGGRSRGRFKRQNYDMMERESANKQVISIFRPSSNSAGGWFEMAKQMSTLLDILPVSM